MFWLVATGMVCLTCAVLVVPLFWSRQAGDYPRRRLWSALAVCTLLPLAALAIYAAVGAPQLASTAPLPAATGESPAAAHAAGATDGQATTGGDLAAAVQRLQEKLARNPQDPDGWRLLAQSYDFIGRSAEAAAARARADQAAAGKKVDPMPVGMPAAAAPVAGGAVAALVQKAEEHRRKREFPQAIAIFAELARKQAMTADLWADYADATGAAQGKLNADSASYIQKALQLDPRHPKALWLLGSYQTDQGDYKGALKTWQSLAAILPPDSSDARIIAQNMGEARQKLGGSAAGDLTTLLRNSPVTPASIGTLRGEIDLDRRWQAKVPAGSVLFIFAKEAGAAGPPLAVLRTTTGTWPLSFQLDDSNAMMPTRTLSAAKRVIVEARISRSGNAIAQAGDLHAVSAVIDPQRAGKLRLVINEPIG
jgi:cytochrome c-type biogenesis protein CcmH